MMSSSNGSSRGSCHISAIPGPALARIQVAPALPAEDAWALMQLRPWGWQEGEEEEAVWQSSVCLQRSLPQTLTSNGQHKEMKTHYPYVFCSNAIILHLILKTHKSTQ